MHKFRKPFDLVFVVIIVVLSLPTLLGWNLGSPESVFAPWASMQFNTALGFLLCSVALLFSTWEEFRYVKLTGWLILAIGLATLLQHTGYVDFRIDNLFRPGYTSIYHGHPGRMSFNSAAALTLFGLGFIVPMASRFKAGFAAVAGSLGVVTIVSSLVGLEQSPDLTSFSHMSIPSAISFALLGAYIAVMVLNQIRINRDTHYMFLPALVSVFLCIISIFVWQYALAFEANKVRDQIAYTIVKSHDELQEVILQTSMAMSRYAKRVELVGTGNTKLLELDSQSYLAQLSILTRIAVVDETWRVKWSYPTELSPQVKNFDQSQSEVRRNAFEKSRESRQPSLSRTTELKSGGWGYVLPVAMFAKGKCIGAVYATVEARKLFANIYNPENFYVRVQESATEVYSQAGTSEAVEVLHQTASLRVGLANWDITLVPTKNYVISTASKIPHVILCISLIFSILIGRLLRIAAKSQKEQLESSERERTNLERLEFALDSSEIGAWSVEVATGEYWRSKNHDWVFGYDSAQPYWNEATFVSRLVPEDREKYQFSKQCLFAGEPAVVSVRIVSAKNGDIRWLQVTPHVLRNEDGEPSRIIGILQDITSKKEKEVKDAQDLLWKQTVLNATGYGIIATDADGLIQTFNRSAEDQLGYREGEVVGKFSPAIFHDPEEVGLRAIELSEELGRKIDPGFEVFVARCRRGDAIDESEWTHRRKDGTTFPVSLAITALRDPQGAITGYLGITADLTEKKRVQKQLAVTHDRLRRVIEATQQGIWERDYESGEITFIDLQARKMFGFADDERPTYETVVQKIDSSDRVILGIAVADQASGKAPRIDVEFRVNIDEDAEPRWLRAHGTVERDEDGKLTTVVATLGDVTEVVKARHALLKALDDAESATQAKSAFLANMSHEIRTPLNGIIGMTDLLLETELTRDQRHYSDIVQQSGTALLNLINDILDFSKIEAGKLTLEKTSLSIVPVVESQIDILAVKAQQKGIGLSAFISPELPLSLIGDSGRLGQILLNLVGNAIKFTEEGGVSVRVRGVPTSLTAEQLTVRFEIEDSGIGMSQSAQSKLFQAFTQAESDTTRKYGGSGLGLSICRRLVELMDGHIGLESVQGEGSTFWFEIPMKIATGQESLRAQEPCRSLFATRALVVEENTSIADTVFRYISSWGLKNIDVTTLENAQTLLQTKANGYDLVLVGGYVDQAKVQRLIKLIREMNPKAKFLYLAEFGVSVNRDLISEAGFDGLVSKPIKQSDLFNAILRLTLDDDALSAGAVKAGPARDLADANSSVRVLVAEDVAVNQLLVKKLLQTLGYQVSIVANGLEVLEALKTMPFDVILMDCQMPEMDGFEATRRIRALEDEVLRTIPIIALTANAMYGDDRKCFAAGMDGYLAKPIKREALRLAIEKWMNKSTRSKVA